jgi:osmotically-inducible protein OsmY
VARTGRVRMIPGGEGMGRRRICARVRAAVGRGVEVSLDRGRVVLRGELRHLGDKRLALERAAAVPGVGRVIDRLRVLPAIARADEEILRDAQAALAGEPLLGACIIRPDGDAQAPRGAVLFPEGVAGLITLMVDGGVITLGGEVPTLAAKQLAGTVAWRVPGCCDVINTLAVVDELEASADDPLELGVRLALVTDPALERAAISVRAEGTIVILEGQTRSEAEATLAEQTAWTVFGVDGVRNRLIVRATGAANGDEGRA